jgi:hypothetical protein
MPPMGRSPKVALPLVALLAAALLASACGVGEERDVKEGEAVELGDLLYNVQLTRFLNDDDPEDRAYLAGQPPPSKGKAYLGVFMTIENEGDSEARVPTRFTVSDTRDNESEPTPVHNAYALELGSPIPPDSELPAPDTPASNGPIQGSMLLFAVDEGITENRPIELTIPSESGDARVELDI